MSSIMKGIIDEAAITPEDLQQRLKATGLRFTPFIEGSLIVNYEDRMLVLVDINGIRIPFYISTGRGGKEKVASGKWYPTFGISSDGYINKGDQDSINAYYGNPLLKAVAQKLDSNLGDLRGTSTDIIPTLWFRKNYAIINRDLSPAPHEDAAAVWKNINATLERLGTPIATDPKTVTSTPKSNTRQQYTYQSDDDVLLIQIAELNGTVVDPDNGTVSAWDPETVKRLDTYAQKNPTFLKKLPGVNTISLTKEEIQLDENLRKWFKEKWVRFGPDGKIRGACARGSDKEGKPKCLPKKKAQALGKKGRKYAGAKKRREDPNPERSGKAKNVATKKKTNEDIPFNECPECRGPIIHESMMNEKQDACYHKVKSRYKVWPSAYASGALVQCRKKGAKNWGTGGKKNESSIMKGLVDETAYEADLEDNEPRIVSGVYGAKSKEFRKKFANQQAQDRFFDHPDREGNFEIHYVQKANMAEGDVVQFPKKHPYEQLTNCKKCGGTLQDGKDKEGKLKICVPCMTIYRAPNQPNVDEGVITQHDAKDPEVAIIGGAGTMSLSRLKKKAQGEAEQLANDLTRGLFKAAAYNIKQLENTLKTIAAAEDEMEKGYFGEDFTGQFAAERTAETNPYGGMRDHQNRGMIGETPTDNPTGASGEGGWRKYRPKVSEDLSRADVDSIERFADKLYKKLGIDVTFTTHFMDQVNNERNGKPISGAELVRLFKKEYERWGKQVAQMGPDMEGTFKDLTTDINLPFVLRWDRDEEELDLIAKTIMRKKNFKTSNQEFPVDESEEQLDEKCWTGYKKVGMKNKGGRQVPNCVKKESAILRGLRRES